MMQTTETQFIIRLNNGDLKAFQQLYEQYYIPLCIYAKRFTRTKEIAEEVVQDVFLRIWEQRGKFMITDSLSAYLFASVRNQCLNHLKHLQVINKFNDYYSQLLSEAHDYADLTREAGDSVMIASQLQDLISKAVESLPEQCRKIFQMSRFDGLKHKDIANMLGITVNTVQRQTSIALEKLREALKVYLSIILFLVGSIIP